ncbi:MAG: S8 family peptidase [Candidatus Komeilibacteria bacterium]
MKTSIFVAFLVITLLSSNFVLAASTSDPLVDQQIYLDMIHAENAWQYTTGSQKTVVAVIDTGVDIYHPDLYQNIWLNSDEIAGDNIDNDHNDYIDDLHGWDFVHNEANPVPKISDDFSHLGLIHGTFVAGIIGARGNNELGLSGLNWQVSIMPLIALDGSGSGNLNIVSKAIDYAVDNGAAIINLSLVGMATDNILNQAIERAYQHGVVIVAAVGNEDVQTFNVDAGIDLSIYPRYPVCDDGNNNYILGVGSVDYLYKKSLYSNFGEYCLDINAPGEEYIGLSYYQPTLTNYRNKYESYWSGTSLATATVSGAAALIKSYYPQINNQDLYSLIIEQGDNIDNFNPGYEGMLGGGVLNLEKIFSNIDQYINYQGFLFTFSLTRENFVVHVYDWQGSYQNEVTLPADDILSFELVNINQQPVISVLRKRDGYYQISNYDLTGYILNQFNINSKSNNLHLASYQNRLLIIHNYQTTAQVDLYSVDGQWLNSFNTLLVSDIAAGDLDDDGYQEINVLTGNKILSYNQMGNLEETIIVDYQMKHLIINDNHIFLAAGPKNQPLVKILDKQGQEENSFYAYGVHFTGGVDLTVNGQYLITAPGQGGGPHIRYFDFEGNLIKQFFAYDASNNQGVTITSFK